MSARVLVREARPEDYAAIGELTVEAYVAAGHTSVEDGYAPQLRDVAGRVAGTTVLAALGDLDPGPGADLVTAVGQVLGSAMLVPAGHPEAEVALPGELEIRMLATDPRAQRRGVARALVAGAREVAAARGLVLVLSSLEEMTAAHRLYEATGFVRVTERDWRGDWHEEGQEPARLRVYRDAA